VDVPAAKIRNCRFETDAPFIIDRHRTNDQPVALRGSPASEVLDCQFIGGQGCLKAAGAKSLIHDNAAAEVFSGKTGESGTLSSELLEYELSGSEKTLYTPYTVIAAGTEQVVELTRNATVAVKRP